MQIALLTIRDVLKYRSDSGHFQLDRLNTATFTKSFNIISDVWNPNQNLNENITVTVRMLKLNLFSEDVWRHDLHQIQIIHKKTFKRPLVRP